MDSRVVSRMIRSEIWHPLKENGFWKFTSRSAWRHAGHQIDVVNLQSFNSYLAEGIGSTTYSFAVNVGCLITLVPVESGTRLFKVEGGRLLPPEYGCHFRKQLTKKIQQTELARGDVWYVDPEGKYLEPAIQDARRAILDEGLPWFHTFSNLEDVYNLLIGDEHYVNGTWGFGVKGSPIRNYLTGYVALALENFNVAAEALEAALSSTSFEQFRGQLERAVALAKSRSLPVT